MAITDATAAPVANGDIVNLARTNPLHIAGALDVPTTDASGGIESKFGDMLLSALGSVNDSQLKAMDLSQQMITDPTNVNVEDVTIALADAKSWSTRILLKNCSAGIPIKCRELT